MPSFLRSSTPAPSWLLQALPELAQGQACSYADFVQVALYHPVEGYYQRKRDRVGRSGDNDFATSSSLGPLFGQLSRAAAAKLALEAGFEPSKLHLVEVGAESVDGIFQGDPGPFASVSTRRLGDPRGIPGGAVVFSNELFDAQPFQRFHKNSDGWFEILVRLDERGHLVECAGPPARLPSDAPEGCFLDLPSGARRLLEKLTDQPWNGLFIAIDYGKEWADLLTSTPQGTARAYQNQRQHNRLLDAPGEQDLTCHVVWDHLSETLAAQGFNTCRIERQEAFFLRHAAQAIEALFHRETNPLSPGRRALASLLHPARFGASFQVLHAVRKP